MRRYLIGYMVVALFGAITIPACTNETATGEEYEDDRMVTAKKQFPSGIYYSDPMGVCNDIVIVDSTGAVFLIEFQASTSQTYPYHPMDTTLAKIYTK